IAGARSTPAVCKYCASANLRLSRCLKNFKPQRPYRYNFYFYCLNRFVDTL
ncbi:hypothetical protein HMPREF9554_01824, partial [Treponema phagedenis F0421]